MEAVRYYDSIGTRTLTPGNLRRYSTTLKSFELQWKSLKERKDNGQPDVPKFTKNLKIIAWSEAFTDFLTRVIRVRNVPLTYVIRPEVDVPAVAPQFIAHHLHSAEHASVEGELITCLSHNSPIFRDDNNSVYYFWKTPQEEEQSMTRHWSHLLGLRMEEKHTSPLYLSMQVKISGIRSLSPRNPSCKLDSGKVIWTFP